VQLSELLHERAGHEGMEPTANSLEKGGKGDTKTEIKSVSGCSANNRLA